MAELKTKKNNASVKEFIDSVEDEQKRKDAKKIAKMMRDATGKRGKMWGANIVGYGSLTVDYANGKTGEWMAIGFSPRASYLSLYLMDGFSDYAGLLKKLGKHKHGKSCLNIKRLSDVDEGVLQTLIEKSVDHCEKREAARE